MTFRYSLIQFLYWFAYGSAINFASVYLLANGASNTLYGIVSAVACGISIVIQPLIASYADRDDSPSLKTLILIMVGVLLCCLAGQAVFYGKNLAITCVLVGMAILIVQVLLPLVNALATESADKTLDFSVARAAGSLGYAVMSFSLGRIIADSGAGVHPFVCIGISLAFVLSMAAFPFEKRKHGARAEERSAASAHFLKRYPLFSVGLIGCSLIYTSHVYLNSYVYQIVSAIGGNTESMGTVMGLAGILEMIAMVLYPWLRKKREAGFWMGFSGIFFTLKALATLLASSVSLLYAVQIFQPLGWGLMTVASVYFVNTVMEDHDQIKGQAYMTMTLSNGNIIGSLSGGAIIDQVGIRGMLLVATIAGLLGTAILISAIFRMRSGRSRK